MLARGIRNNNPGNIRHSSSNWLGLTDTQQDKEFCTFTEMKFGCRALIKLLMTYVTKYNLYTVRRIITKYAPSNENNTIAYVHSVSKFTGFSPDEKIDFSNINNYVLIAKAIARHECGEDAKKIESIHWTNAIKLI